jgi:ATP-dependent Clp protease ATP-binding subunit ClpC
VRGYNFSERFRRSLAAARVVAARLESPEVSTEHLLLGLLETEPRGVIAEVLERFAVPAEELRSALEARARTGPRSHTAAGDLPYTASAKEVLAEAMAEARELQETEVEPDYVLVGTEHLFLGFIREPQGGAGELLRARLMSIEAARGVLLRLSHPA